MATTPSSPAPVNSSGTPDAQRKIAAQERRRKKRERQRDEIDMVIDAVKALLVKVKTSSKPLVTLGLVLFLLGFGLAGWPTGWMDESRGGYWALDDSVELLGSDVSLGARDTGALHNGFNEGQYVALEPGDRFTIEGVLSSISYYGPLENEPYPEREDYAGLSNNTLRAPNQPPGGNRLTHGTLDTLLHPPTFEILDVPYVSTLTYRGYYFANLTIEGGVFNEVRFREVIFENVTFNGTFFLSCNFERVTLRNVTFTGTFFSYSRFAVVKFENTELNSTHFSHNTVERSIIRDSAWQNVKVRNTHFTATKWSSTLLTGSYFRNSTIDVVVFRNLTTRNVQLVDFDVTNVADVPSTGDLDFTFITVRDITMRVNGNLAEKYPENALIYVKVTVKPDGVASTGTLVNGTRIGYVQGDGLGILTHEVLVVESPDDVHITLWHFVFFMILMIAGAWTLVFAIGGVVVILALAKFFAPFFIGAMGVITLYLIMPMKQFLMILRWMTIYIVPPAGKETVIPIGIGTGANPWALALAIAFVDIVLAIFLAWNFDLARRIPFIGGAIRRLQDKGEDILEEKPWVERLAFFGIVLFVIIPLQGSGALGGTMLGRAMGVGRAKIVGAVTTGGLIGAFAIAISVEFGLGLVASLDAYSLLLYLLLAMVLFTLWYIYRHREELGIDEFKSALGWHTEGSAVAGAAGLAGSAGAGVARAVGGTSRVITRSTTSILDSILSLGDAKDESGSKEAESNGIDGDSLVKGDRQATPDDRLSDDD